LLFAVCFFFLPPPPPPTSGEWKVDWLQLFIGWEGSERWNGESSDWLVERVSYDVWNFFFVLVVGLLRGRGVRGWSASIITSTLRV